MKYYVRLFRDGVHEPRVTDGTIYPNRQAAQAECAVLNAGLGLTEGLEWRIIEEVPDQQGQFAKKQGKQRFGFR